MNPRAQPLRDALVRTMDAIPGDDVAIFLSGGYDSWSLVFAARAAGKRVWGYVFHMPGQPSTDLRYARQNCQTMDVNLQEFQLPSPNPHKLIADIGFLKRDLGCRTKAEIECVWPFKKAMPSVLEKHIAVGHEDLYGCTKQAAIHFRDNLDAWRVEARDHAENQNAALCRLAEFHDRTLWMPYEATDVRQVFAGANWDDLHKPSIKQPTVDAFPEEFARIKVVRQGLQVGDSGIRDAFECLLESPYNVTKARDVTAIYNRV